MKHEYRNPKQYQNSDVQNSKQKLKTICCCCFCFGHLDFDNLNLFRISSFAISCFEFSLKLVPFVPGNLFSFAKEENFHRVSLKFPYIYDI
jgi:hypothetical protein